MKLASLELTLPACQPPEASFRGGRLIPGVVIVRRNTYPSHMHGPFADNMHEVEISRDIDREEVDNGSERTKAGGIRRNS